MTVALVTGASGFIGSHLVEHLLRETDFELLCPVTFRHKGDTLRVRHLNTERVHFFPHDLTTPFSERELDELCCVNRNQVRTKPIDYIVNVASESHVDRSITEPVAFVQNNVTLMLNMLEMAREVKPKLFLQVSTDEVYGVAPEGVFHKEWARIMPSNPYSASKACQEALAIAYWRTYSVPLVITNTMNNYGERQDPEKFVPLIIKKLDAGEPVPVHGTEDAVGSRFYLHARNHADALLYLLRMLEPKMYPKHQEPHRFNIVGDREVDNLEMVKTIAGMMGVDAKVKFVDFHSTRPGHDQRYALDGSKLADWGWRAKIGFEDSLKRTIRWTLENREWLK